jgi:intraflagellar transport protein 80
MALLYKKHTEAENIYIQNKFYFRAIKMNINSYRWDRALKLARDFKNHLDIVVALRKKYLERIGKEESNKDFVKASQEVGEINWDDINKKIA